MGGTPQCLMTFSDFSNTMRTTFTLFFLQLAAILGSTAIALAQTEEASGNQEVVAELESKDAKKPSNITSPGIIKKFEDWVGETAPLPVLNDSTPEWVKNGLVLGDEHSLAISSTFLSDLDQCREDLKATMMSDVQAYLDKHVLKFAAADQLAELTQEYVEKYWVKKGQEFDNIQDRPSGMYHQLWIGLHISSEQLAKVRKWEAQSVREQRTKKVGVLGGISVVVITLLSGAVGVLARREKAKLKG